MPQQRVYAVIGCIQYEGADFRSLRLFDCLSTAKAYAEQLEGAPGEQGEYDWAEIEEREINFESALATA
jgi:hypothetical protein